MTPAIRDAARRSLLVLTGEGEQLTAGRACLFALERVGWHPRLIRLAHRAPLLGLVEIAYRIVSRHRNVLSRMLGASTDGSEAD